MVSAQYTTAVVLLGLVIAGCADDRVAFQSGPAPRDGTVDPSLPSHSVVEAAGFRTKAHMNYHRVQKQKMFTKMGTRSAVTDILTGTFVTPCDYFNCFLNGNKHYIIPCSSTSAERIESDGSTETDITIYVNNYHCKPNASEVLAKVVLKSNIIFRKQSSVPANKGGRLIIYNTTSGNFTFNYQKEDGGLLAELNQNCRCTEGNNKDSNPQSQWLSGQPRNLKPSDCAKRPMPVASMSELCNLVVGNAFYQTYKWVDKLHYVESEGSFDQNQGWALPLNMSLVVAKLPESASKTPADCDYIRWPKCQEGITNSKGVCDSCSGLECELCIYRELPSSLGKEYEWNECCPCLYYEANTDPARLSWMRVNC